jgi:hypothetical protein
MRLPANLCIFSARNVPKVYVNCYCGSIERVGVHRVDPPSGSGIDLKQSLSIAGRLELNVKAAKGRGRPTALRARAQESCFFSRKQRIERSTEGGLIDLPVGWFPLFSSFRSSELSSPSDVFSP